LAREFHLPGQVQHFIEAHHGTTLVEFFFHRACKQAQNPPKNKDGELEECYVPDEFEYRYPGPKPRTKEVAILMISDAVESAARAMTEPTTSRIDTLVRGIANKRLLDGQFDDCELTLKDLHLIVESISRTVASMYHGRIAYPSGEEQAEPIEQRA
jgi:membrane-associated HD superfamily phosphohydrolase